jgi:GT2 family glycosyltransferase
LPLVSIVIPTAGRSATLGGREIDLVVNCVQSLHRSEHYGNYEIVLVHNGDLRAETLSQLALYPRLRLVAYDAHPFNLSDKINLGVTAAAGDYVLLLNDDMQAQSAGILQSMLGRMHDGVGLVGGRLLFANGSLQHAGVVWTAEGPTHAMIGEQRLTPGPAQRLQVTHDVFGVSGACMFARRPVFLDCGGFPPDLPLNYNDVALCLNVRASGLRVVFNPDVTMFHFESVSKSGTYFWELQHLVLQHPGLSDPYLNPVFDSGNPFYQLRPHAQAQALSYRGWLLSRIDWRRFKRPSSQDKKFSMILSVYETPLRFLLELEATLLRQTYRNWELALVDNGCRVPEVVAWIDRMRLHSQVNFVRLAENMGIMGGYGAAFRAATGDYVVPVDSDDLLSLDCLDVLAYHLEQLGWPDAVYSDEDKTDSRSSIHSPFLKPDWDPVLFMNICYVCHVCAIDRVKALAIGAYADDAAAGCHDWDSFLRLLRAGARIAHVPEVLYTWRIHAGSTASIETGNKPYTLTSQRHVLEQHVRLTGLSDAFEVAENTLFPHDGIWRLRPTGQRLPPLTLAVLAAADPVRTAQFLGDLASARRPDRLRIVIVGRHAAAFDPSMSLIDEVRRVLWPDGPIEHAASLADAVSADTRADPVRVVAVVSAEISTLPPDWLHEGLGMFGFAEDVGAVGGTIVTEDGMTIWRGGFAGFGGAASSPDFGGPGTDSGYHGMGWCQRSVDAVPAVCFMARATLLDRALAQLGPTEHSMRMVTGWLAIEARASGLRTIHTPFMWATLTRLIEVGPLLPPGAAFKPTAGANYYPASFGQTIDAAYRLVPPHA